MSRGATGSTGLGRFDSIPATSSGASRATSSVQPESCDSPQFHLVSKDARTEQFVLVSLLLLRTALHDPKEHDIQGSCCSSSRTPSTPALRLSSRCTARRARRRRPAQFRGARGSAGARAHPRVHAPCARRCQEEQFPATARSRASSTCCTCCCSCCSCSCSRTAGSCSCCSRSRCSSSRSRCSSSRSRSRCSSSRSRSSCSARRSRAAPLSAAASAALVPVRTPQTHEWRREALGRLRAGVVGGPTPLTDWAPNFAPAAVVRPAQRPTAGQLPTPPSPPPTPSPAPTLRRRRRRRSSRPRRGGRRSSGRASVAPPPPRSTRRARRRAAGATPPRRRPGGHRRYRRRR